MGLLDDAIREHLEFKRRHGADSEEVARQEHEALGPMDRGDRGDEVFPADSSGSPEARVDRGVESAHSDEESRVVPQQDPSYTGEETAELDMRAVLADVPAAAPAEDSLEWEVPADSRPEEPRMGAESEAAEGLEGPVEDVLEETPDFLRETPDQDRLWFEQQPPRDFDFDK